MARQQAPAADAMSGYRTPFYNKAIGDTAFSMHQWGRASDIFLDKDHDGVMDDLNKDKIVNRDDAVALANELERLAKTPELSAFIGGIGIYAATTAHGPPRGRSAQHRCGTP